MIISRAPYRVSFVGGGTDLKSFYQKSFGLNISTSINKYIYIIIKRPKGIIEKKYKINMGKVQHTDFVDKIKHPIVRETLKYLKIDFPIEIGMYSDLPSKTGLGSSSTFTVALIKGLFTLQKKKISKYELAELAAYIEINKLKRNIGKQDHYASTFGGLNKIKYFNDNKVKVSKIKLQKNVKNKLISNLRIYFSGIRRDASKILKYQNNNVGKIEETLIKIRNLVEPFEKNLTKLSKLSKLGNLIKTNWELKKKISSEISSKKINSYFKIAIKSGASGGKILGAGGGGFFLFYVNDRYKKKLDNSLKKLVKIDFDFEESGVKIIYNDKKDY
jgi:D-glycero-alpha-D-manno-heptose-7-phosphate kinase